MKIINLSEGNSLLNQYVAELRDVHVQNDRMRFRRNIERIGEIMAYEMSKALTYSVKQVQTPLGTATASTHDDKIVIATVFRAGLPLHTGFLCSTMPITLSFPHSVSTRMMNTVL